MVRFTVEAMSFTLATFAAAELIAIHGSNSLLPLS